MLKVLFSLSFNVGLEIEQFHLDCILPSSVCHHFFERALAFRLILYIDWSSCKGLYFLVFSLNSYNLRHSTHPILELTFIVRKYRIQKGEGECIRQCLRKTTLIESHIELKELFSHDQFMLEGD